ncbi:hypothetical protein BN1708_011714 [Verticillium longisporum]|uniref:Uncharacterized protein n=1 Tax=Verticillium longisporum TaxID=100787 RepID=A0A0G4L2S4_VERLO|nr:hypothetical protein BN1708_011714 [Verticillium longisporum]
MAPSTAQLKTLSAQFVSLTGASERTAQRRSNAMSPSASDLCISLSAQRPSLLPPTGLQGAPALLGQFAAAYMTSRRALWSRPLNLSTATLGSPSSLGISVASAPEKGRTAADVEPSL